MRFVNLYLFELTNFFIGKEKDRRILAIIDRLLERSPVNSSKPDILESRFLIFLANGSCAEFVNDLKKNLNKPVT